MIFQRKQWNLGFSTLGCPDFSFFDQVAIARRYGFRYLELRAVAGSLDLSSIHKRDNGVGVNWLKVLRAANCKVISLNTSWKLDEPISEIELRDWADLANELSCPFLRVFGGCGSIQNTAKNINNASRFLSALKYDCLIVLETHGDWVNSKKCRELIELCNVPLMIIWDVHHTIHHGKESPSMTWDNIGRTIVITQVKDSIPIKAENYSTKYVLPGNGNFPIREALKVLQGAKYNGILSLEWERLWHSDLPPIDEALSCFLSWIE